MSDSESVDTIESTDEELEEESEEESEEERSNSRVSNEPGEQSQSEAKDEVRDETEPVEPPSERPVSRDQERPVSRGERSISRGPQEVHQCQGHNHHTVQLRCEKAPDIISTNYHISAQQVDRTRTFSREQQGERHSRVSNQSNHDKYQAYYAHHGQKHPDQAVNHGSDQNLAAHHGSNLHLYEGQAVRHHHDQAVRHRHDQAVRHHHDQGHNSHDHSHNSHDQGHNSHDHRHNNQQQVHHQQERQHDTTRYTAEDYAYIPGTEILRPDGTVDPKFIALFNTGYLMVLRSQAPAWVLGSQQDMGTILGVPLVPEAQYMVFIPALGYEQVVPWTSISDNPADANTFLVQVSERHYVGTKLYMIETNKNQDRNIYMGTANQPSTYYGNIHDAPSLWGVPIIKDQTYFIYVPQFNNEYSVTGEAVSPNPDDKHTIYVTIYRRRYKGTAIRPVFPDLIPRNAAGERVVEPPITYSRYENPRGRTSEARGKLIVYGVTVSVGDMYYVYIPVLKEEFKVHGAAVQLNPQDPTTILVVLNNTRMVGTGLRPADDAPILPVIAPPPVRHTLIAYGVPINPHSQYTVFIPGLDTEYTVHGQQIYPNASNAKSIVVNIQGVYHVASTCRLLDNTSIPNNEETMELRGIITAFGIPVVPTENYLVYIPHLKGEYLVEGAAVHSNPDNEMTVLAIMENTKFVCTSLRRLEEQIVLPKLPIGTVLQSSRIELGSNGSSNSETMDSERVQGRSGRRPSGLSITRVKHLSDHVVLDLSLSSSEEKIVKSDPSQSVLESPLFVLNGVEIYPDKYYQITVDGVKTIVSGKTFQPPDDDQSQFTVNVNEGEKQCSNVMTLCNALNTQLSIPSTTSAFEVYQSQIELDLKI